MVVFALFFGVVVGWGGGWVGGGGGGGCKKKCTNISEPQYVSLQLLTNTCTYINSTQNH